MSMVNKIEKLNRWSDYTGTLAQNNKTVQGFYDAIKNTFDIDSSERTGFAVELNNVTLWKAVQDKTLTEETLDRLARQLGFPVWGYVGRYNLDGITELERKREMMKNAVHVMRARGTAYSIYHALLGFGFTNVIINENNNQVYTYDGTYNYDGAIKYSGPLVYHLFSVELTTGLDLLPVIQQADDEQLRAIVGVVNGFKKLRVKLFQVTARTPSVPGGDVRTIWTG